MKVICPSDPTHNKFYTTAHEVHDWIVDSNGEFVEDLGCSEVSVFPDVNNEWHCTVCRDAAVFVDEE